MAQTFDDLSQRLNASGRLFAAVAIGKKYSSSNLMGEQVRRMAVCMSQLHRDVIDMDDPSGMIDVERILSHVKADGWQCAS
ncbi:hypothetical protein N7478_006411 [Penicillium angulare]|uniref:uncharacterized protein n=1 Tax=Penicillium angulare TaxID=116970 RepID=UPI00253FEB55|nr:uncharacterized protein N7478_006411 [Penicillium angulare]KAJ5281039.1 hypothetical protein N7478_006411 [Penicillium angulare]